MQASSKQLLKPKSISITPVGSDANNCKIVMSHLSVVLVIHLVILYVVFCYLQW